MGKRQTGQWRAGGEKGREGRVLAEVRQALPDGAV